MQTDNKSLTPDRWLILGGTGVLFAVWLALNFSRLTCDQNGTIRLFLGLLFAVLILFRPKDRDPGGGRKAGTAVVILGVAGVLLAPFGIIFNVHQLEWLGILLLFWAGLSWALPAFFARDMSWLR